MTFKTFKDYCENQDATAHHPVNVNQGYFNQERHSFEQVIDPIVEEFVNKIQSNVLNQYFVQLQPVQLEYIINKIKSDLGKTSYNANNDLGNTINDLWRKGNSPVAGSTPQAQDTSLATQISNLFRRGK